MSCMVLRYAAEHYVVLFTSCISLENTGEQKAVACMLLAEHCSPCGIIELASILLRSITELCKSACGTLHYGKSTLA